MTARFVDSSDRARVLVRGKDARAFLHRLSTQHVKDLAEGQGRLNVLLSDKGRIVDIVHHLDLGARGVLLVGGRGRGEVIRAWLDRYLFSEDVELVDESALGGAIDVIGPVVDAALAPFGFEARGDDLVVRTFDRDQPAFIVVSRAHVPSSAGAAMTRAEADDARIAAMAPGENEACDKFNPLDVDLAFEPYGAVHWNKGCYIGQEVVARLDTYAKQQRGLFGLVVDPRELVVGAKVMLDGAPDGAPIGELTSVASVDQRDRPSALAVLKLKEPREVVVSTADGQRAARALKPAWFGAVRAESA